LENLCYTTLVYVECQELSNTNIIKVLLVVLKTISNIYILQSPNLPEMKGNRHVDVLVYIVWLLTKPILWGWWSWRVENMRKTHCF